MKVTRWNIGWIKEDTGLPFIGYYRFSTRAEAEKAIAGLDNSCDGRDHWSQPEDVDVPDMSDPIAELRKEFDAKLEAAMIAIRNVVDVKIAEPTKSGLWRVWYRDRISPGMRIKDSHFGSKKDMEERVRNLNRTYASQAHWIEREIQ